jgi:hypothetical protein
VTVSVSFLGYLPGPDGTRPFVLLSTGRGLSTVIAADSIDRIEEERGATFVQAIVVCSDGQRVLVPDTHASTLWRDIRYVISEPEDEET